MFVLHEILRFHIKLVEGIPYSAFIKLGMQSSFRAYERISWMIWIVEHMKLRIHIKFRSFQIAADVFLLKLFVSSRNGILGTG
jgi:hypothetical protein